MDDERLEVAYETIRRLNRRAQEAEKKNRILEQSCPYKADVERFRDIVRNLMKAHGEENPATCCEVCFDAMFNTDGINAESIIRRQALRELREIGQEI